MGKFRGFISEYTSSYALVSSLKNIFDREYSCVIPVLPWTTREGTNVSRNANRNNEFRIIGIYPRRPKMQIEDDNNILIRINDYLPSFARHANSSGIPIIAGIPIVRNIMELGTKHECLWLDLKHNTEEYIELQLRKDNNAPQIDRDKYRNILSNDNLLDLFETHSVPMTLDAFFNSIKIINKKIGFEHYISRYPFGAKYRPFYLFVK